MQLHASAIMKNDEFILEELILAEKFVPLIYDLIASSMWKKKILPLLKPHYASMNSLKMYLTVYHEAVICNMLEVMLFHYTAVKESNEYLI